MLNILRSLNKKQYLSLLLLCFLINCPIIAQNPGIISQKNLIPRSVPDSLWRVGLDANDILYWVSNNGLITNSNYGMRWKDLPGNLFNASGFNFGVLKPGQGGSFDTVSVSIAEFGTEFQAGRILNTGHLDSLITQNPDSSNVRIFMLPEHSLLWPPEAPHNGSGQPLKLSARDTWAVFNDLSPDNVVQPYSPSPKLGIECQRQTFQFLSYPFNNAVIVRMKIINKSNLNYVSCYFGLWGDPDAGSDYGNDMIRSDSNISLIYCLSDSTDLYPYAAGIQLLQSAAIPGTSTDTADRTDINENGFCRLRLPGMKNILGTSAMAIKKNYNEPDNTVNLPMKYDSSRYQYMQGLDWYGNEKPSGPWDVMIYETGWDRRCLMGSGPFDFPSGDTLDIWYALIGATGSSHSSAGDTLKNYAGLIKENFFSDMNSVLVGINEKPAIQASSFTLLQNYPNPFNPSTTIKYRLNEAARVTLKIFNTLGQEVRTLVSEDQIPGTYVFNWDGRNNNGREVSSGIYIYQLKTGKGFQTKKLILLK